MEPSQEPHPVREVLTTLRDLLLWLLVALALRWMVLEPRWIPSGSMLPTLQLEDRVLVQKILPRLGLNPGIGSIVVFHPPERLLEAGYDSHAALIKRVVAVAGDRVEVRDGRLWRNGVALDPDWAEGPMNYTLPPLVVPPGHLMVLGDNRNASLDSHVWGPLPSQEVIGTAVWRYWPPPSLRAPSVLRSCTARVGTLPCGLRCGVCSRRSARRSSLPGG